MSFFFSIVATVVLQLFELNSTRCSRALDGAIVWLIGFVPHIEQNKQKDMDGAVALGVQVAVFIEVEDVET